MRSCDITRIFNFTGQTPKYFRFPGICHSAHDDQLVEDQGLAIDNGNLISGDAFSLDSARIIKNILGQVKPADVILMHVGGPNAPKDLEVLRAVVPKLKDLGYTFGIK